MYRSIVVQIIYMTLIKAIVLLVHICYVAFISAAVVNRFNPIHANKNHSESYWNAEFKEFLCKRFKVPVVCTLLYLHCCLSRVREVQRGHHNQVLLPCSYCRLPILDLGFYIRWALYATQNMTSLNTCFWAVQQDIITYFSQSFSLVCAKLSIISL